MANILIVDDEAAIADLIQLTLAQAGHKSETAASGSGQAGKRAVRLGAAGRDAAGDKRI